MVLIDLGFLAVYFDCGSFFQIGAGLQCDLHLLCLRCLGLIEKWDFQMDVGSHEELMHIELGLFCFNL